MFDLDRMGGAQGFAELLTAVVGAGELALAMRRTGAADAVRAKADQSPVTAADAAAEEYLRRFLASRYPDASFLGEETGEHLGEGALRFVVDPIDGTRAYIRGLPTWAVLLGVEYDADPVVGVAFFPASGDLYSGARGAGAAWNGRPIRLSSTSELEHALVCHGGLRQFTDHGRAHLLAKLGVRSYTQRCFGDFANYAAVLQGKADAVVEPGIKPYDVAPAAVLLREAGGWFTALDGKPTIYGPGAIASNGPLHDELVELCGAPA
jgi:histidinol-phosphatase